MGNKTIFSVLDYNKRKVVLEQSTWNNHIIVGHPEMNGNISAVKNNIENPEFVYDSSTNPKREIFFSRQPQSTYPMLFVKTIVEYNKSKGYITTALFTRKIQGVNKEGLKYVKPKI